MVAPELRIFFDTSVYIAALLSPKGASGELVRLAEARAIRMVVSERIVVESDRVLARRFPELIEESRRLWKVLAPEISPEPNPKALAPFLKRLRAGDASILCSASLARVRAFTTWNTQDFMKPGLQALVSFPLVIPGECLRLFRSWIAPFLD